MRTIAQRGRELRCPVSGSSPRDSAPCEMLEETPTSACTHCRGGASSGTTRLLPENFRRQRLADGTGLVTQRSVPKGSRVVSPLLWLRRPVFPLTADG